MKNKLVYLASFALFVSLLFGSAAMADNGLHLGWGNFWKAHDKGSTVEVHFADNGNVLVRGAEVTGASEDSVNARTSWDGLTFDFRVDIDSDTRIIRKSGDNGSRDNVAGEIVSFQGSPSGASSSLIVVDGKVIKNWSDERRAAARTTLEGRIRSIPDTTLPAEMIVRVGDRDYTIVMDESTSILNLLWLRTSLASFDEGDRVVVHGEMDADFRMDATVVRKLSL